MAPEQPESNDQASSATTAERMAGGMTRTVVRGAGIAGVGFALKQALSLASAIALARVATPRDFGQFAAGSILVAVGAILSESGMLAAVIQRRDRIEEAANTAVVSTIAGGFALGLLALAAAPLVGLVFDSHTIGAVAAVMSGTLVLNSGQLVPQALLQRRFSFLRRVVSDPLVVAAFGVAAVIACSEGMGVWGLVVGAYTALVLEFTLAWTLARWKPRLRLASVGMWRELIAYGRFVLASELVIRGGHSIQTLLIGRGISTPALGQYQYAMRIAGQPLAALVNVASYVLFPTFAHIASDERRLCEAFLRSLKWIALIALPSSMLLLALGEPLAVLLFGEIWRPAGAAIMALSLYSAGHAMAGIGGELFKATGRTDLLFRMHAVSVVLAIGLMLLLLPLGLRGVAAALSLSAIGMAAYSLTRVPVVLPIGMRRLLADLWAPAAAAAVAASAVYPLEQFVVDADSHGTAAGLLLLGFETIFAGAIYALALLLISPRLAAELFSILKKTVTFPYRRLRPLKPNAYDSASP